MAESRGILKYDNCKGCKSGCEHAGKDREFCYRNESCKVVEERPLTNADRIRAMSDEELARCLLYEFATDQFGTTLINKTLIFNENDMVEWLQQPVKED